MGALGSLLSITKSYIDEERKWDVSTACKSHPMALFVVKPLLGVVTAFAVFVFLQAGLALTDGALGENPGNINPYFIAFVAIVAGLMSRQAIDRIERWGRRFLGEQQTPAWAYGLRSALEQKNQNISEPLEQFDVSKLAKHLGASEEQVQAWITQHQRVPPSMQERIIGFFGMDRRRLFVEGESPVTN